MIRRWWDCRRCERVEGSESLAGWGAVEEYNVPWLYSPLSYSGEGLGTSWQNNKRKVRHWIGCVVTDNGDNDLEDHREKGF